MAACTGAGWVTGPMCPSPSSSITSPRARAGARSAATARTEAGEVPPTRQGVGRSSDARSASVVGARKAAGHARATVRDPDRGIPRSHAQASPRQIRGPVSPSYHPWFARARRRLRPAAVGLDSAALSNASPGSAAR